MLNVNFTGLSGLGKPENTKALRTITSQLKEDGGNTKVNNFTNAARSAFGEIREVSGTIPATVEVAYIPPQEDEDFFETTQPGFSVRITDDTNNETICSKCGDLSEFLGVFEALVESFKKNTEARDSDKATEANVQRLIDEFA